MTAAPDPDADRPAIVDLLPWLERPQVRDLLAASLYRPRAEDIDQLCRWYRTAADPVVVLGLERDGQLLALVGGVARGPGSFEALSLAVRPDARRQGHARRLLGVAASALQAERIIAHTDSDAVDFYRACGFALTPVAEPVPGVHRYRATRAAPGLTDDEWFSAPRTRRTGEDRLEVELPPGGNTLPRVPNELGDEPLPAFVVEWLLETDEIGLILQTLLPDRFPPTTPPIRPRHAETFLGPMRPLTPPAGPVSAADDVVDPDAPIPGLPTGVELPMAVQQVAEMGQRLAAWLAKGARVQHWARSRGHGDAPWLEPIRWAEPPDGDDATR